MRKRDGENLYYHTNSSSKTKWEIFVALFWQENPNGELFPYKRTKQKKKSIRKAILFPQLPYENFYDYSTKLLPKKGNPKCFINFT